jgi:hypothetical protein
LKTRDGVRLIKADTDEETYGWFHELKKIVPAENSGPDARMSIALEDSDSLQKARVSSAVDVLNSATSASAPHTKRKAASSNASESVAKVQQ